MSRLKAQVFRCAVSVAVAFAIISIPLPGWKGGGTSEASVSEDNRWSVSRKGNILEINYASGLDYPQYAALNLDSSDFRMNYGPRSGWGTSVILLPSFWIKGLYHQGAPITARLKKDGANLVISFTGTMDGLKIEGTIRITPPSKNAITAIVSVKTTGDIVLDNRTDEAFKPLMLSSMHVSSHKWDAKSGSIGSNKYELPKSGWIIKPAVKDTVFGLKGGTSKWKKNAPSVRVTLDQPLQITGWVTESNNTNDANVGLWAASDKVLTAWSYTIKVMP